MRLGDFHRGDERSVSVELESCEFPSSSFAFDHNFHFTPSQKLQKRTCSVRLALPGKRDCKQVKQFKPRSCHHLATPCCYV